MTKSEHMKLVAKNLSALKAAEKIENKLFDLGLTGEKLKKYLAAVEKVKKAKSVWEKSLPKVPFNLQK